MGVEGRIGANFQTLPQSIFSFPLTLGKHIDNSPKLTSLPTTNRLPVRNHVSACQVQPMQWSLPPALADPPHSSAWWGYRGGWRAVGRPLTYEHVPITTGCRHCQVIMSSERIDAAPGGMLGHAPRPGSWGGGGGRGSSPAVVAAPQLDVPAVVLQQCKIPVVEQASCIVIFRLRRTYRREKSQGSSEPTLPPQHRKFHMCRALLKQHLGHHLRRYRHQGTLII